MGSMGWVIMEYRRDKKARKNQEVLKQQSEKTAKREEIEKMLGQIFVTDKKYRLPVCLDSRALKIQNHDEINLYHIVLENDNEQNNYGIYANGLLVESISLYDATHWT